MIGMNTEMKSCMDLQRSSMKLLTTSYKNSVSVPGYDMYNSKNTGVGSGSFWWAVIISKFSSDHCMVYQISSSDKQVSYTNYDFFLTITIRSIHHYRCCARYG
jgi:hypothetical protein